MDIPSICTIELNQLITKCWDGDAALRPSFSVRSLSYLLNIQEIWQTLQWIFNGFVQSPPSSRVVRTEQDTAFFYTS
jgi:hypothetical protein